MKRVFAAIAGMMVCSVGLNAQVGGARLESPWAARDAVKPGTYSCPSLKPLPKDITASDFYSDPQHSIVDEKKQAAYKAAEAQFQETMVAAEKAADQFRASGDQAAADCVLRILKVNAATQSMTGAMSTNQANYVQNWTLGALGVSWLKVRDANPGTAAERATAIAWMDTVGKQVQQWFTERHNKQTKDGTNNHYYWAGFAAVTAAVAANDRPLYDWGIGTYHEAISRIQPDGTLPLEMDRGQRALHYHLFALAPIVMLAEFGEANHVDLYAERHGAIHTLVKRTLSGMIDNSYFAKVAKAKQDTPDGKETKSTDVLWLVPYLQRFPDEMMNKVLHSAQLHPYNYLGGYPPGWPAK